MIFANLFLFRQFGSDGLIPDQATVRSIQAEEMPSEFALIGCPPAGQVVTGVAGQKNPVTDHDRTRRSRAGQLGFPGEVFGVAPLEREPGRFAGAHLVWTAKLRPPLRPKVGLSLPQGGASQRKAASQQQTGNFQTVHAL